jgi:hypothetical protein
MSERREYYRHREEAKSQRDQYFSTIGDGMAQVCNRIYYPHVRYYDSMITNKIFMLVQTHNTVPHLSGNSAAGKVHVKTVFQVGSKAIIARIYYLKFKH